MPVGEKHVLRFGPFLLDTQIGQLRKNGVGLKLQGQPVQILELLLERPQRLVTREEIRQRLWSSDTFVDFDHSIDTAVKKLRQALGDGAETPRYIETLPKRGYRFIGEVTEEEPRELPARVPPLPEDETLSKVVATLVDAVVTPPQKPAIRRTWVKVVAVVALLLISGKVVDMFTRPRMPRIVASHALTKTGYRKAMSFFRSRLVTDGRSIYFQESRPSGSAIAQVLVSGGEAAELANNIGNLRDISKDGSELLLAKFDKIANRYDTWIQPLPTGPARLIVKDADWPLWTPDGRGLLFARNGDKDLYRANADGTDARRLAEFPNITDLAISPDGRHVRFGVRGAHTIWEASSDGSNPHPILTEHRSRDTAGSWSPAGKFYFFRSWDGDRFNLWAVSETRSWWRKSTPDLVQLTSGPISYGNPVASKDGKQIFATGTEPHGELSVYDFRSGKFVPYLSGIPACYVDFSRDGKWIAYVSFPEGNLWRSKIDGTEQMQLTSPPLGVVNPRWSPDGKLIAFTDLSGGDRRNLGDTSRIYVVSAEGGAPLLLLAGNPSPGDPTWSPDGTAIAYGVGGAIGGYPGEIRILDVHSQKSTKIPSSEGLWSPRWSPDGRYLVALGGLPSTKLMLFSFATQQWEELASGFVGYPCWSRDSKQVFIGYGWLVLRITISSHKTLQVADMRGFRSTGYYFWTNMWYGIAPDGRPISTRDTATEEIYAFDLEYK